ncbi:MAG: hypothetical protein Q9225_000330 [Loekoesia sp. 1 TL-2023]
MSGYRKLPDHSVDGYVSNARNQVDNGGLVFSEYRLLQDTGYIPYGHNGLAEHTAQPLPGSYDQRTQQLGFTNSSYEPNNGYDTTLAPYSESTLRITPVVTSWNPKKGSQGTPLYIYIESNEDLALPIPPKFFLFFAAQECSAILTRLDSRSADYKYVLTTEAPALLSTGWHDTEVPLRLHLQDQSGASVGTLGIGSFRYIDQGQSLMHSSQGMLRKRKLSSDSAEITRAAAKRAVSQQLLSRASRDCVSGPYHTGSPGYPPTSRSYFHSPSASSLSSYEAAGDSFRRRSSTFSGGSVRSYAPHANQGPGWGSNYAVVNGLGGNTTSSAAASSTSSPFLSTTVSANPPLVRTTQLPRVASLSSHDLDSIRVSLHINGDLDSMAENWTSEERKVNRRLVQFWRSQNGRFVNAGFERVPPDDKAPKNTCVNCIYWDHPCEDRRGCYVTSVDTISILELLVGMRFDVPEKNRVRRNLEGFGPITMHKGQENIDKDTDDFYRLIMTLPHPKPRNIEKAIKVYPWKVLGLMLKKVSRKYSANYFPITNRPSGPGGYAPTSQPGHLTPETYPNSPHSTSNSTDSSACSSTSGPRSSTTSPNISHGPAIASTVTQLSQSQNTIIKQSPSVSALPLNTYSLNYPNVQYSYPNSSEALSPTSVQAPMPAGDSKPFRGPWGFGQYTPEEASKGDEEGQKARILQS